jgi:hypothetical protein
MGAVGLGFTLSSLPVLLTAPILDAGEEGPTPAEAKRLVHAAIAKHAVNLHWLFWAAALPSLFGMVLGDRYLQRMLSGFTAACAVVGLRRLWLIGTEALNILLAVASITFRPKAPPPVEVCSVLGGSDSSQIVAIPAPDSAKFVEQPGSRSPAHSDASV